jgi:type IV pilus assembly protein PilE
MTMQPNVAKRGSRGFTLIDLVIAVAIVAILLRIAFPSYQAYIVRSSRQAAQSELVALANAQEKIYLNSSAYTSSVAGAYTGQSTGTGGLGVNMTTKCGTANVSKDCRYTYTLSNVTATTFTLTATPVTGTTQANDGNLTITESGARTWGSKTW